MEGKSEFLHPNPKELLRKYAGTGIKKSENPGQAGYKENVDFEEFIGIWKNKNSTESLPTTKGTIYYDGKCTAHIIPAHPHS